jgi:hypothetical protein
VPGERAISRDRSNNDVATLWSGQHRCDIGVVAAAACGRTAEAADDCGADGACGVAPGPVRRGRFNAAGLPLVHRTVRPPAFAHKPHSGTPCATPSREDWAGGARAPLQALARTGPVAHWPRSTGLGAHAPHPERGCLGLVAHWPRSTGPGAHAPHPERGRWLREASMRVQNCSVAQSWFVAFTARQREESARVASPRPCGAWP